MPNSQKERNESPICCIFFCEFDHVYGPKLTYQVPEDIVSEDKFNALNVYLIPKKELEGRLITVNSNDLKVIGFPVGLDGPQFPRNRLIFNLCFVCASAMRTVQYEPVVKKLAQYLINLEKECGFISNNETKSTLPKIMAQIRDKLTANRSCELPITASTTIYLKVARVRPKPDPVEDHDVPIFLTSEGSIVPSEWDLTTQQVISFIDGNRHVAKIASEADVEVSLVKACIQNMIYYEIITLIPIFQYSNVFVTTPKISNLVESTELQEECLRFVAKSPSSKPNFRSVFQFYCNMTPGVTLKDLCIRLNPSHNGIDEKKLVHFGSLKSLIRRLNKYPILVDSPDSTSIAHQRGIYRFFDGNHSYDKICTEMSKSHAELEEKVERHPSAVVCWK
ncbi:GATOR complex protein NPRL2-like [Panonychus citri]|uniref:GATOR complex protein NPRL2-like n=1 Tax=Panonychus citri TaxID=50023 RepID=UPI0023075B8A|nr:GATOR complex protein NPRL2-like [Panonychus citri]